MSIHVYEGLLDNKSPTLNSSDISETEQINHDVSHSLRVARFSK